MGDFMKNKKLNIYILSLSILTILCYVFAYRIYYIDDMQVMGHTSYSYIALFVLLAFLAETFHLTYGEMAVSTGFAITVASTLYFGVFWSMIILSLGVAIRLSITDGKIMHILNTPLNKTLFNVSNISISIFLAGMGYIYIAGNNMDNNLVILFIKFIAYISIFLLVNTLLISILVSILTKDSLAITYSNTFKYGFLCIVFIAPLGIILTYLVVNLKSLGILLFMLSLLFIRYIMKIYIQ